jgi:hypothetical protein
MTTFVDYAETLIPYNTLEVLYFLSGLRHQVL